MRLIVDLTEEQVQRWINQAYNLGWKREEPRKRWSEREKKEAVRWAIERVGSNP